MNPRQGRGNELQDHFRLPAPQPLVESAGGDGLVGGDDNLERFRAHVSAYAIPDEESCRHAGDPAG